MRLCVMSALGEGHTFGVILLNADPITVFSAVRNVPATCSILWATANPVEILLARSEQDPARHKIATKVSEILA